MCSEYDKNNTVVFSSGGKKNAYYNKFLSRYMPISASGNNGEIKEYESEDKPVSVRFVTFVDLRVCAEQAQP